MKLSEYVRNVLRSEENVRNTKDANGHFVLQSELKEKRTNSEFARVAKYPTDINWICREKTQNLCFQSTKSGGTPGSNSVFIANASPHLANYYIGKK